MPSTSLFTLLTSRVLEIVPVRWLAALALAGTATLWGTSMAATKAAMHDIHPVQLACLRFLVAGVLLSVVARLKGPGPVLGWRAALLGLVGVTLFIGIQNVGLQSTRAADATIIIGGALPVATAMLGLFVLGERLEPLKLAGLVCSIAGILIVGASMRDEGASSPAGMFLLLLAALSGALYATMGRRTYQSRDLLPLLAGCSIYGALFLAPIALLEAHTMGAPVLHLQNMGWLLFLGAGCSALGFVLWAFGLRHLTAIQNALICNLELPVGLLTATLAGEHVQGPALTGGLLVILGATLAVARRPVRAVAQVA